ncbi:hypothetical protein BV378_26525 [Nostoc sp. RF31YmG]|jgi:hypothetical protein|nr:hypothetical protein BV378_26525 [Nostoc sp. RF31YmG]
MNSEATTEQTTQWIALIRKELGNQPNQALTAEIEHFLQLIEKNIDDEEMIEEFLCSIQLTMIKHNWKDAALSAS